MKTKCERGIHAFVEAYDEVPSGMHFKTAEAVDAIELRKFMFYRVVRAIYCTRCGKQLPLEPK